MNIYIDSAETISPQDTFDNNSFLENVNEKQKDYFSCKHPDYTKFISPKVIRRMSNFIKNGVTCFLKASEISETQDPDAILFATGLGCTEDTAKFLKQINDNNETLLNPTPFIHSLHNTVPGQTALLLKCKNYNLTYSQKGVSFETALTDAFYMLHEKKYTKILIGSGDEITEEVFHLLKKAKCIKETAGNKNNTDGYIPGEGFSAFTLTNIKSEKNTATIGGIRIFVNIKNHNIPEELTKLLTENNLRIKDVDVVISGINEDKSAEKHYITVKQIFNKSIFAGYKHLTGEYDTASGFALWTAAKMIHYQKVPETMVLSPKNKRQIKTILIHSFSKEHKHSFILIKKS